MRFEQKLKSRFLKRENLHYWGLSDYTRLNELHNEFLNLDKKLSVSAMDFETISDQLIRLGVVETMRSTNITAMYAVQWMCGQTFDFSKSQVKIHRARLKEKSVSILHCVLIYLNLVQLLYVKLEKLKLQIVRFQIGIKCRKFLN